jgi:exodeoxyribonuclease VII large subunit
MGGMSDELETRAVAEQAPDPDLPGPFAVGRYAARVREAMRARPKVLLEGEIADFKIRRTSVFFELRDADGGVPVAMWRNDFEGLGLAEDVVRDGARVVVGGGPDYYPGSQTASPSWSFRATHLRLAGEGDLLARLARLRRRLADEGLFEPQKQLRLPRLPKRIGLVTAAGSAAKADVLAGLARRGWGGELVFCDVAVQNRRAAPEVGRALQELVAVGGVEVILVCRGGGSPIDLLGAFCDEVLCRTVALLPIPVVSAIGHESDTCLLDDVAAVTCSTPTHAPERLVAFELAAERARMAAMVASIEREGREAVRTRSRTLALHGRGVARQTQALRGRLHQLLREVRAASTRGLGECRDLLRRYALVTARKGAAAEHAAARASGALSGRARRVEGAGARAIAERRRSLEQIVRTVEAHDPQRVLERGFARVEAGEGRTVSDAAAARAAGTIRVRFARDHVEADVRTEPEEPA